MSRYLAKFLPKKCVPTQGRYAGDILKDGNSGSYLRTATKAKGIPRPFPKGIARGDGGQGYGTARGCIGHPKEMPPRSPSRRNGVKRERRHRPSRKARTKAKELSHGTDATEAPYPKDIRPHKEARLWNDRLFLQGRYPQCNLKEKSFVL